MKKILLLLFFLGTLSELFAQVELTGQVFDAETNDPLIGASIMVKNQAKGTITDVNGKFNLKVDKLPVILIIGYVGYANQEIEFKTVAFKKISLGEDSKALTEAVVKKIRVSEKQKESALTVESIAFSVDGTKLYRVSIFEIAEYILTTPYDLNTASFLKFYGIQVSTLSKPKALTILPNGRIFLYFLYSENQSAVIGELEILEYSFLQLGAGSFQNNNVGMVIEANSGEFILKGVDGSYVERVSPSSYLQAGANTWALYDISYNSTDGDLELSSTNIGNFDLTTASFVYSLDLPYGSGRAMDFSSDGTKLFILSGYNLRMHELTSPYDLSTCSTNPTTTATLPINYGRSIKFTPDGLNLFILTGGSLEKYTLTSPYTISGYSRVSYGWPNVSGGSLRDFTFDSTGSIVTFLTDYNGLRQLKVWKLRAPYDLSGTQYTNITNVVNSGYLAETRADFIAFSPDGLTIFIYNTVTLSHMSIYSLSKPYALYSYTLTGTVYLTGLVKPNWLPWQMFFSPDGSKFFLMEGAASNTFVYEFSLGTVTKPIGYRAVHTTVSTDTSLWGDIDSMTASENLGDGSVHYSISSDNKTTWKVLDNTQGERDIVKNNGGTWQYNSNATYSSETWTNVITNTLLDVLAEAMSITSNRMDKAQLDSITDANQIPTTDTLDLAIIFNAGTGPEMPSSNGVSIDYQQTVLNKGAILGTDYDFYVPNSSSVQIVALAANILKIRVT